MKPLLDEIKTLAALKEAIEQAAADLEGYIMSLVERLGADALPLLHGWAKAKRAPLVERLGLPVSLFEPSIDGLDSLAALKRALGNSSNNLCLQHASKKPVLRLHA